MPWWEIRKLIEHKRRQTLAGNNITHVRSRNRSVVLETIFRMPGICRRDIGFVTGLAAGAVSDITKELIDEKLIVEDSRRANRREKAGRAPVGLHVNNESIWAIGSLIDRQSITVGLSDLGGNIAHKRQMVLKSTDLGQVQEMLIDSIDELMLVAQQERKTLAGIGISIPGMVVPDSGIVSYSAILGWQDVMLGSRLQKSLPLPIVVDNDVRGLALAQYWFHDGPNDEFLLVYFGDGIASCDVEQGQIRSGNSGAAGQIGHSIVEPNGPKCACGNQGCLEAVASQRRMQVLMEEEILKGALSRADLESIRSESLSISTICTLLEQGDEAARSAFRRISPYFGIGLSNLIKIYDPPAIVLVGELFTESRFATEIVKREIFSYFLQEQKSPEIIIWNKGDISDFRLVGSGMLALDRLVLRPDSGDIRK